eukprot:1155076-Pelagomonas_calceolata.AAC.4
MHWSDPEWKKLGKACWSHAIAKQRAGAEIWMLGLTHSLVSEKHPAHAPKLFDALLQDWVEPV